MAEINSNPITKYLYERDQAQEHAVRRLAKQRGWDTKPREYILQYVRANWNNSAEPTMLGSKAANQDEGYTKRMTLRQHLKSTRRAHEPARLNAVERSAEDGNYKTRSFDPVFIEQVKQMRNDHGLTQKDLAVSINRPVSDIASLERGDLVFDGELKSLLHQKFQF
jgi:DNA-binding transcriptional regulator YiaG